MFSNKLNFIFCIPFIAAWIVLCIAKYKKWSRKSKYCTKELTVRVVRILQKKTTRGVMLYKPIFMPEDATYNSEIDSAFYSSFVSFELGEKVELLVNPDDIKDFIYKDNSLNKGRIFDMLGCCIPLIIFIVIMLIIIL